MGMMKNIALEQQEALYEEFLESQREDLRKEGAEELRIEILRVLQQESKKTWSKQIQLGIETAIVVVEQANR
jgi:hypothetical protein